MNSIAETAVESIKEKVVYSHVTNFLADFNNEYVFGVGKHTLLSYDKKKEVDIEILSEVEIGYKDVAMVEPAMIVIKKAGKFNNALVECELSKFESMTMRQTFIQISEIREVKAVELNKSKKYTDAMDAWMS